MACLYCGREKTIEAHLIPKAFVMEVKRERGEQHLLVHEGKSRPAVSHTGRYDRALLCAECDGTLGRHECYAHSLLKQLRALRAPHGAIVAVDPVDGDTMVRFAAGIAWKFSVTKPERGKIRVGPYQPLLADVAIGLHPVPPSIDVAMVRIVDLDGDVYFYRNPLPDRQDGNNVIRFSVGSFVFFLKIDKRRNGTSLPPECWLRGRSKGAFPSVPAESMEEGRLHAQLAGQRPVRSFFQNMYERSVKS